MSEQAARRYILRSNLHPCMRHYLFISSSTYANAALTQGSTVSLQLLYSKREWYSCYLGSGRQCVRSTCPGLYLNDVDLTNCWGEVFQIYRKDGPGFVRVGDIVGFHYPRQSGNWLSLWECNGRTLPCPGTPTSANGFSSDNAWFQCWGEVFRIYARGKSNGEVITSNDNVFIYHIAYNQFLSFVEGTPKCATCPGPAPPTQDKYEPCWGENFEIWH